MLRIAHIFSGNDTGGAMTHVVTLLKALRNECQVTLIVINEGLIADEIRTLNIPVHVIEPNGFKIISEMPKLAKYCNENFDLVHSHGTRANLLAGLLHAFYKVKTLSTTHSDYLLEYDKSPRGLTLRGVNQWCYKSIPYHIAISQKMCSTMIERGVKKQAVFAASNGLDLERYAVTLTKDAFLKQYELTIKPNDKIIGIVARIHPVKGLNQFIISAIAVCQKRPDVLFIIAGGGDPQLKKELLSLIQNASLEKRIRFLGRLSNIANFYNAIDINVLTSLNETFPYVLMEGGYFGKPAISSRVGGVGELIDDGETGLLFESGDTLALSQKMISLLENETLSAELGAKLKALVLEKHTSQIMAARHIAIYREILKQN